MNDPDISPELSARLESAAASLDAAADRYQHQARGHRPAGSSSRQATRIQLLVAMAASLVVLLVGTSVLTNRRSTTTRATEGVQASIASTVMRPVSSDPLPTSSVFVSPNTVDLGSASAPTEIRFPTNAITVDLRVWWAMPAGSATTVEVGSPHGFGTFRAASGQTLVVASSPDEPSATITISLLDMTTNDPVVAEFTLPGRGSVKLPATGRYAIAVDTQATSPSVISFTIR